MLMSTVTAFSVSNKTRPSVMEQSARHFINSRRWRQGEKTLLDCKRLETEELNARPWLAPGSNKPTLGVI